MSGLIGGGDVPKMPVAQAEQPFRTAQSLAQTSETARKNRRRSASMLTRGWGKPKLSEEGMLGL